MSFFATTLFAVTIAGLVVLSLAYLYLWMLAGIYAFRKKDPLPEVNETHVTRFAFIVPAHNEEPGITSTIRCLMDAGYPRELFEVVVVADNCTDRTAEIASRSGARCLERFDTSRRGKGFALQFAFEALLQEPYDAFVVIDADSLISSSFLAACDVRMRRGERVVQAYDGLSNPDATVLTYVFQIGNIIENRLFWEAKECLGLPVLLRGNGMCFSRGILESYPWSAFSIVEDTEYAVALYEHGERVHFAPEMGVFAHQPENLQQAFVQRVRWASGNSTMTKQRALGLMLSGIRNGNPHHIDLGVSLLVGSRPLLALANLVLIICSAMIGSSMLFGWAVALLLCQAAYIGVGVVMNGISWTKIRQLLHAPFYLVWLCAVSILGMAGFRKKQWARTTR